MYLLSKNPPEEKFVALVDLLVSFFVRRNVTDFPNTYALDALFMDLIAVHDEHGFDDLVPYVEFLQSKSSDDERFESALKGDMYDRNVAATRFVLCALEEDKQTRETMTDLWKRDAKNKFIWTVEHIFPQGENIPAPWVQMIADGDSSLAKQYRDQYVHKLGNLTLTGYNSKLSNMSFEKKRDRKDKQDNAVGYKNGLAINTDLCDREDWSVEVIESRTETMVEKTLEIFSFERFAEVTV